MSEHSKPKVYVRMIFIRIVSGCPELLMQVLDNGHLQFIGGLYNPEDRDHVESVIRELSEETQASRGLLRTLRSVHLLYGSLLFALKWQCNEDVYFVLRWYGGYENLLQPKDVEITSMLWVDATSVLEAYRDKLYPNTKRAIKHVAQQGWLKLDWEGV